MYSSMEPPNSVQWEQIPCPICSSKNNEEWRRVYDRFNTLPGQNYRIVVCVDCGFRYLNPRPSVDSMNPFYAHEEYDPFISARQTYRAKDILYRMLRRLSLRYKMRIIHDYIHSGKLLDVGCGTGEFLQYASKLGWDVMGMEPNKAARQIAREKGLNIKQSMDEISYANFNVLTLWHVLEHIHELTQAVQQIERLLRTGGIVILAMPNVDSWDMKRYQTDWVALDTPRHLYHFTEKNVRNLFTNTSLRLIDTSGLTLDTFYNVLNSEQVHYRRTGTLLRPLYMARTMVGSFIHDAQHRVRRASGSVYILQKEKKNA